MARVGGRGRTVPDRRAPRLFGTVGLLVAVTLLASCAQSEAESSSADPRPAETLTSTGDGTPTNPSGAAREPGSSGKPKESRALRGSGFAAAVPGSDDPGRKEDTGPVIPLSSTSPDIERIERLVREVERITEEQRALDPEPVDGSLEASLGTFGYRYFADGSVQPDPDWVAANIRTEPVPILGEVNCHRAMIPQLRAALAEIAARGLADTINPEEYAGCYVPRFINRDPADGLSLHTWGIAVDLNVPGNLRGTQGEIDRTVVSIFKKWGFAWGGDWSYTDPMHFELARLVKAR